MVSEDDQGAGYGRKAETAAAELRRRIMDGDFPPGAHLRQDDIAVLLGQSRVPVREALKVLTAEKMVVHRRNRGHFVAELTADEMSDVCWMREVLEAELARTAVDPSPQVIGMLEELNGKLEAITESGAPSADFVDIDNRFHEILWRLSPRRLLIEQLQQVANQQRPYRILMSAADPGRDSSAVKEHYEIIEALRGHDSDRYQALLALHVVRGRGMVTALASASKGKRDTPQPH
jgi:DNA-binding GntR family transcriptional regulator